MIRAGGQADATEESSDSSEKKQRTWRTPGPVLQGLIAFAIYLVVFILAFGQSLLQHPNVPRVGQVEVDPNFYIWAIRWWPYAITHGLNPLYSHQIGAPAGYNLAWATTTPTLSLLMWPITATVGPIAAFNLSLLLAPPASAWAMYVAARQLTGKFWPALLTGPVFGFCLYELAHSASGQPNLTVTLLLPLSVYLVLRWWDGSMQRNRYIIWMGVLLALEFYTFVEAFAELTMVWVGGLVLGFILVGRAEWPKVARLALHTAIAYVGALILAAPYLFYALRNYPKELIRQLPQFSMDLAGLIYPRPNRLLGMEFLRASAGHNLTATAYVGLPMLLLLLALAIFAWSSKLVRLLALSFVLIVALAVGPNLIIDSRQVTALPWSFIWRLPLLRSAEPVRFIDFGYLILGLALALWLAKVTESKLVLAARWALGVLALAAIFANLPTFAEVVVPPKPIHWKPALPTEHVTNEIPSFFTAGTYRKYVKPGENVVIASHRGNAGMMIQAYTGFYFNIAGGFINASLSTEDALPAQVRILSHPTKARVKEFRVWAKKAHIGAVIVERAWSEHWMYVFGPMGYKTTTVGGVTIFQIK
ncbi:MAG TPA: hypothetical protein VN714_01560 [Trebonia sp.]|nr:hypothetical protein [Trebonia sp.]